MADATGRHLNQSYLPARHLLRICKAGFAIPNLKPDWLRISTDITAQGPFNDVHVYCQHEAGAVLDGADVGLPSLVAITRAPTNHAATNPVLRMNAKRIKDDDETGGYRRSG